MAVKLRLRRMGKKKQPFYRIVAIDSRVARDGKYIEKIGHFNPLINPPDILINEEKALLWLKIGAIPSDTVRSLLSKKGIMLKWHLEKNGFSEDKIEEEMKKWEVLQIEKQKREEALAIQKEHKEKPTEEEVKADLKTEESATEAEKSKEQETDTDLKTEGSVAEAEKSKEQETDTDLKTEESVTEAKKSKEQETDTDLTSKESEAEAVTEESKKKEDEKPTQLEETEENSTKT